jgi:VWFA-related protein
MRRRAAIAALLLQAVLRAVPQEAAPGPLILKSASHVVQLDVFVSDSSGRPVHGLQKNDFMVTDNGHPREIRIFAGEVETGQTAPFSATGSAPGVYSNRFGMRDSPIVTAIVVDAVPRPAGLQKNPGMFSTRYFDPERVFGMERAQVAQAIYRMGPGETIAIYAACPDLRVVQDYTSDRERLVASLKSFAPPRLSDAAGKKQTPTIDALVPPMLSALREVAQRMSGASGRKSVVWISPAYGTELNPPAIREATESTIDAFNDANVPLYAVDTRFSPTCIPPANLPAGRAMVTLECSQTPDISNEWMEYLARSTGGRAFSGGNIQGVQERDADGRMVWAQYRMERDQGIVSDALRFAIDDSRYSYAIGFYVPESELDGQVHALRVNVPAKPKYVVRYRSGYTASASAAAPLAAQDLHGHDARPEPASAREPDQVGIDATIDMAGKAKNELRVSLAVAPETVTRTADGAIVLDTTFAQTGESGKQLAEVRDTVRLASPGTPGEMVRFDRTMKLVRGAALLHVTIRDPASNRVGSLAIPVGR